MAKISLKIFIENFDEGFVKFIDLNTVMQKNSLKSRLPY